MTDEQIHFRLWIADLLRIPVVPADWADIHPNLRFFTFGSPKRKLQRACVMGTVVQSRICRNIEDSGVDAVIRIDDGSGTMTVVMPRCGGQLARPAVGQAVDVIGQLKLGKHGALLEVASAQRYIVASGYDVKTDPLHHSVWDLQLVQLYRGHYFASADPAAGGLCLPNELWRSCQRTAGVSADLAQHMPDPLAGALHAIIPRLSLTTVACHLRYGAG